MWLDFFKFHKDISPLIWVASPFLKPNGREIRDLNSGMGIPWPTIIHVSHHMSQDVKKVWVQLSATYNAVLRSLPRHLDSHLHPASVDLSSSHDTVRQDLVLVSSKTSSDKPQLFFSHRGYNSGSRTLLRDWVVPLGFKYLVFSVIWLWW